MSQAIPSRRSSGVTVTSSAMVSAPSLATSHPGISSEIISTSARSMTAGAPLRSSVSEPLRSSSAMAWLSRFLTASATAFMFLPCFGPSFLKSGLTRFTSTPSSLPTTLMSLTLISLMTRSLTASSAARCESSATGIITVDSG